MSVIVVYFFLFFDIIHTKKTHHLITMKNDDKYHKVGVNTNATIHFFFHSIYCIIILPIDNESTMNFIWKIAVIWLSRFECLVAHCIMAYNHHPWNTIDHLALIADDDQFWVNFFFFANNESEWWRSRTKGNWDSTTAN